MNVITRLGTYKCAESFAQEWHLEDELKKFKETVYLELGDSLFEEFLKHLNRAYTLVLNLDTNDFTVYINRAED